MLWLFEIISCVSRSAVSGGKVSLPSLSLAGHQSFMAPSCSVLHCPAPCTCSNNIVDCRGKALTEIPTNLPETITEMYVP